MNTDRCVLIVDAMNLFVRSWAAYPTMSSHGYQMGGCIGFLKTLGRLVGEIQPASVVVAWEGGGSQRRRKLFPEYKLGRRSEKLNRFYGDDIPETEENKNHQMMALLQMLKHVPVCQVYASDCEGDDIVAFLCTGPYRNREKIIVSSDKDMYQLLDDRTKVYSLHKKTFVTPDDVFEEFRVKTHNFALAKALCGDPGDNVPGVKGLGFKTVSSKFPLLGSDQHVLLQELLDFSHSHSEDSIIYRRVSESADDVKRNWQLVYLDGGMLSASQVSKLQHTIDTFEPRFDRMGLMRCLLKEGVNDFDVEGFFYSFKCIDGIGLRTGE
jgi:5'-3' exonuclease